MTARTQHNLSGPAPRFAAWVRDADGNPKQIARDSRTGKFSVLDKETLRDMYDYRPAPGGARQPRHLFMRDVISASSTRYLLETLVPRAAQCLDAYEGGNLEDFSAVQDADENFIQALVDWRKSYVKGRRRDADSLFLQLETVLSLNRVIEATYARPSIEDAFPITTGGTLMDSMRTYIKETPQELAVVGGDVSLAMLPMANIARGERFHRLVRLAAGATITDHEIERFREIQQRNPNSGLDFDLWAEKLKGAADIVQRGASMIEAFGSPANQIPGLFRSGGDFVIPAVNLVFQSATSTTNYDNINTLVQQQQAAVGDQVDLLADSIALDPRSFRFLSQQIFNNANASNVSTMEMIMRGNDQIQAVYQVRECRPRTEDATALEAKGMDAAEALINSGGLQVGGTQRNALVLFKRDKDCVEIVHGFSIRTTVYPPVRDETSAKVDMSTGGLVVHKPATMRIAYEN